MTAIYIPLDLLVKTLLRLPIKSLFRFRCVSKVWSAIITSRDFKNRHMNMTASPRLLIAFKDFYGENILLVSSPNPNSSSFSSSSSSSSFCSYRDLSIVNIKGKLVYNAVRGLICVGAGLENVRILNPSTRKVRNFPQLKFNEAPLMASLPEYMFGYDPVGDQYKVLAVDCLSWRGEHKVFALGEDKYWREAPCVACPHVAATSGMYMNGTVYYGASLPYIAPAKSTSIIVSFDVRLETFNIIEVPIKVLPMGHENLWGLRADKTLINYRGKIGVVENPREGSFKLWVVEDPEEEEWSFNTFHLPESAAGLDFDVMNTFNNDEICLVPRELSDPFCLFYYNLEKKSMRRAIFEGLPVSELKRAEEISVTVSDHYETFMFFET